MRTSKLNQKQRRAAECGLGGGWLRELGGWLCKRARASGASVCGSPQATVPVVFPPPAGCTRWVRPPTPLNPAKPNPALLLLRWGTNPTRRRLHKGGACYPLAAGGIFSARRCGSSPLTSKAHCRDRAASPTHHHQPSPAPSLPTRLVLRRDRPRVRPQLPKRPLPVGKLRARGGVRRDDDVHARGGERGHAGGLRAGTRGGTAARGGADRGRV